jgi:(R)-2-hydroxyacyl-CoA dehydratese activating ATPase
MITVGVDVGALFTKVVVLADDAILASRVARTTGCVAEQTDALVSAVLAEAKIARNDLAYLVATGTGAAHVSGAAFIEDEVICAGAAAGYFVPRADLVIHAGGQSIAAMRLDEAGEVADFVRNDKCASGSGRFIEMIGRKLGVPVEGIDATAAAAAKSLVISAQCGVFAESEVITLANQGESIADILGGVCASVAGILAAQARRFGATQRFTLTGGVARFGVVATRLGEKLGAEFEPCGFDPQLAAAVGAAMLTEQD